MKNLLEPKASVLTITYGPEGEFSYENPPRFTWMPESEEDLCYRLQISSNPGFDEEHTRNYRELPYNFFTPDEVLEPGTYYWRYTLEEESLLSALGPDGDDGEAYGWSTARTFEVGRESVKDPLPGREHRYDHGALSHPRIWLNKKEIGSFREGLAENKDFCGFAKFYQCSVLAREAQEFPQEPLPYPGNKRVIPLWRQNYMYCQEALCYIRSLAVAGILLEEDALDSPISDGKGTVLIAKAKAGLMQLASWDPKGPTARNYNDECAFRVAYGLAFGYDWLYDYLSEEERKQLREVLFIRTKEVADHIITDTRIHYSLYDSHAVRSLSSVILPCCIVLLGDYEEAEQWLNYAIEYFDAVYTPWGGRDGGWAEGPSYWTTGMAFVTEALNTLKSFIGIDLYQRPFFQKTGDFPLYCNPVDTYRSSFCDQSNLGEYPDHKVAFNIRQFAGVTGNSNYQWYYEEVFKRAPVINQAFYNKGWWDFYFDDMVYRYDYRERKLLDRGEPSRLQWFQDIGWAAVNDHRKDFDNHIFLLTKSSPYGSVSHSQGDQNTFVLFAYGEPFIITSGYYIGFNSSMHRDWRRQTKSHNTILIDGHGQYAGMDKVKQLGAKGCISLAEEREHVIYIKETATEAYREEVPGIRNYTREIYYADQGYVILVDTVETQEASRLDWILHSLSPFEINGNRFVIAREKGALKGTVVYCSSGIAAMTQSHEFEGVDPAELAGLEKQWHLDMKTGKAQKHVILSLLVPEKKGNRKMVNAIKDDQGMDIFYYFESDGRTITIKIDGSVRR